MKEASISRVNDFHELMMCCWLAKLLEEEPSADCGTVKKWSDSTDQMAVPSTALRVKIFQAFRCVHRKFSDTIQRLQRHVGSLACVQIHRNFYKARAACTDDEGDEDREQPEETEFFRENDKDFRGSMKDWKVRLYFPCWPCLPATKF